MKNPISFKTLVLEWLQNHEGFHIHKRGSFYLRACQYFKMNPGNIIPNQTKIRNQLNKLRAEGLISATTIGTGDLGQRYAGTNSLRFYKLSPVTETKTMKTKQPLLDKIREYLEGSLIGATQFEAKRIRILLQDEYISYIKCPKCLHKFEPEDGKKSAITMYPVDQKVRATREIENLPMEDKYRLYSLFTQNYADPKYQTMLSFLEEIHEEALRESEKAGLGEADRSLRAAEKVISTIFY